MTQQPLPETHPTSAPHPPGEAASGTNAHIGGRARLRRRLLRLTQAQVAAALGITFQQLQKYETGANRISASRLVALARVLDVPVSFFFDGVPGGTAPGSAASWPPPDQQALELLAFFGRISDPAVRKNIAVLTKAWADAQPPSG